MSKIVYIHGFGGSIHSNATGLMSATYPDFEWCPLEVTTDIDASLDIINKFIADNPDVSHLIGSSLGGFYVICADFAGPKLVINPTVDPMKTLSSAIGEHEWRGRRDNGEKKFKFTKADLFKFKKYNIRKMNLDNVLCHYTEHDQVLGEGLKKEYPKIFKHSEMVKELHNHFMSESYIKSRMGNYLLQ